MTNSQQEEEDTETAHIPVIAFSLGSTGTSLVLGPSAWSAPLARSASVALVGAVGLLDPLEGGTTTVISSSPSLSFDPLEPFLLFSLLPEPLTPLEPEPFRRDLSPLIFTKREGGGLLLGLDGKEEGAKYFAQDIPLGG